MLPWQSIHIIESQIMYIKFYCNKLTAEEILKIAKWIIFGTQYKYGMALF